MKGPVVFAAYEVILQESFSPPCAWAGGGAQVPHLRFAREEGKIGMAWRLWLSSELKSLKFKMTVE